MLINCTLLTKIKDQLETIFATKRKPNKQGNGEVALNVLEIDQTKINLIIKLRCSISITKINLSCINYVCQYNQ